MAVPLWQPGTLYQPGDIVQPITAPPPTAAQVENGDFAAGNVNWDFTGGAEFATTGGYSGNGNCVRMPGNVADGLALNRTQLVVPSTGSTFEATAMINQGASIARATRGWVEVRWYDVDDVQIAAERGNVVEDGSGGAWHQSKVLATRPAGAAYARAGIGLFSVADHNHPIWGDNLSVSGTFAGMPDGLVYKAVQPESGFSDSDEPAWPPILGQQVIDNEVIWEAVASTRVTWEASPLYVSGDTEPTWPTDIGGFVKDGTINWKTVSRRVEDENCPDSNVVVIGASKVFVGDDDIVRYCATVNPLDWTSKDDAGYLPTGLQNYGSNPVAAMGLYRGGLVVFNAEGFQLWQIDEDPASMSLIDALPLGSTEHKTVAPVANDLLFASPLGIRSLGVTASSTNYQAGDVGVPIDPLFDVAQKMVKGSGKGMRATYHPSRGQYLIAFPNYPPPDMAIIGSLPNASSSVPYEGRLLITSAIGAASVIQTGGDELPAGHQIFLDGDEIVVQWPAAIFPEARTFALQLRATDSMSRTADWSGVINAAAEMIPTWSLSKKGSVFTVSGGGVVATAVKGGSPAIASSAILSNFPKTAGKWYVEIEVSAGSAGNVTFRAGLARATHPVQGNTVAIAGLGATTDSWCQTAGNGECYHNGNFFFFGDVSLSVNSPSDRFGIAYDASTGKAWFRKVGVGSWRGDGDPVTGSSPSFTAEGGLHFAASLSSLDESPEGVYRVCERESATIPAGFAYWNDA